MSMLTFCVCVHGKSIDDPLPVSFEQVAAALAGLPRLFLEPDGSFVWRGTTGEGEAWQVDGNLIDRGDVLAYVDLNGHCRSERLDELLRAFGWPASELTFQLPQQGILLDEAEFRLRAATEAGAH